MEILTTEKYWDCECEVNYINPKSNDKCMLCGTFREDSPDSRVSEVERILHIKLEK